MFSYAPSVHKSSPQTWKTSLIGISSELESDATVLYTHDNVSARMIYEEIPNDKVKAYYLSKAKKATKSVDAALNKKDG